MKRILLIAIALISGVCSAQTFKVQNLAVLGTSTLTGATAIAVSPTMPTPTVGDNSTKGATTAFVANHSPCQSILDYGGDNTGARNNDAALTALFAAEPVGQKCVYFAPGKFKFASPVSYTTVNTIESVTILGAGADLTELTWASGNGITINYLGPLNSAHVRDMTITTGTAGGGTGLNLNQTAASIPNPANTALSDVIGVVFRGADGYVVSDYWTTAINVFGVSNINFFGCVFDGNAAFGGNGTGISISGSPSLNPVAFNITSCVFNWNTIGLDYGTYTQGVSVSQSNFTGGTYGIAALAGALNLDQLTVQGSQFNQTTADILLTANIPNLMVIGNEFIVQTNAVGISLPQGGIYSIIGNTLVKNGGATSTNGIVINNSTSPGVVSGNVFLNLTTAVNLQAGSTGVNVQANAYVGNTNNVVNAGAGNSVGIATI